MAARPSTRTRTEPAADPAARPAVRDFTTSQAPTIDWDVRPVYDFLFSLSGEAGALEELPAQDRRWLDEARAALTAEQRASVSRFAESELMIHLAGLLVEDREIRTADALVEAVRSASARSIVRAILAEAARDPKVRDLVEAALSGDAAALDDLGKDHPEWGPKGRLDLLRDPDAAKAEIVSVLSGWAEQYKAIEDRIGAILSRDYDLRAGDRATITGPDLIEKTTGGVRWMSEAGTRRIILAPSYFSRPYNYLLAADDWRFFGYPVADDALDLVDPLAPPLGVIRLHRALGDATRLRILKLLAGKDLYLTEIAQQLELSKPTIKHHLALLRIAGLVTVTETGNLVYYSLRRTRLEDASVDLKRFLTD